MTVLEFRSEVEASQKELFDFHLNVTNVIIVTPPSVTVRFTKLPESMKVGSEISVEMRQFGILIPWDITVEELKPNSTLIDVQSGRGPFRYWKHEHLFVDLGRTSELIDRISYVLPFGVIGRWIDLLFVRWLQKKVFHFRHEKTKEYFRQK